MLGWGNGVGAAWAGSLIMSDQIKARGRNRRGDDRNVPRRRWPFRHGLRRRHVQHGGLSGARGIDVPTPPRSATIRIRTACFDGRGRRHQDRTDAARGRPAARSLHDRDRQQGRAALSATGAARRRRASCSSCPTGIGSPRAMMGARLISSPASRCRSIPTPASAGCSRSSRWRASRAPRSPSTATSGRRAGRATCPAPAPCSWRR